MFSFQQCVIHDIVLKLLTVFVIHIEVNIKCNRLLQTMIKTYTVNMKFLFYWESAKTLQLWVEYLVYFLYHLMWRCEGNWHQRWELFTGNAIWDAFSVEIQINELNAFEGASTHNEIKKTLIFFCFDRRNNRTDGRIDKCA